MLSSKPVWHYFGEEGKAGQKPSNTGHTAVKVQGKSPNSAESSLQRNNPMCPACLLEFGWNLWLSLFAVMGHLRSRYSLSDYVL